jgi:integrase
VDSRLDLCPLCAPKGLWAHTGVEMPTTLTDTLIRSLRAPKSGRLEIHDEKCTGLVIRVTPAGAKTWSFRFRDPRSGVLTRATIGPYPEIALATARERAIDLRRGVASGINPIEAKRRERELSQSRTFGALAERYLNEHARRFKRSAAADERNLRLHVLPKWAKGRFDEITRADVIELCEGMVAAGTQTNANRVQALISKIFAFGVDAGLMSANPSHRLAKRGVENRGRRVLTDEEIALFWTRSSQPPVSPRVGLALKIALLTAARAGEVAGMCEEEIVDIDSSRARWEIPAHRSKNGHAHVIPLSALAAQLITEAMAMATRKSPFVFASPTVKAAPITAHALAVAMQRMGCRITAEMPGFHLWLAEPPSPHDLRRTVATRLASLGVPSEDVAACLNHVRRDVTGRHYDMYARLVEKRRALDLWAQMIERTISGNSHDGNVLPMMRKQRT